MNHKKIPLNHHKKKYEKVKFSLIIVSDTRYQQFKAGETPQDLTTPLIEKILLKNNHILHSKLIVPDEKDHISQVFLSLINDLDSDIILISGGTGIGKRDVTLETIQPLFNKEITGFGELFRYISYEKIGSADKKLVIYENSGHAPMDAQPYEYVEEIISFVERL